MEIAEFLLERVAEAEAYATYVQQEAAGRARWAPPWTPLNPAHVLAECKAKRRIVERALELDGLAYQIGELMEVATLPEDLPSTDLLRLLALPYADHSDYREEWRL